MTRTEVTRDLVRVALLGAVFALMGTLAAIDLALDLRAGTTASHVVLEGLVTVIALTAALVLATHVRRLARAARDLRTQTAELAASLDASRVEAARWRADASHLIRGLSAAIDQQFERWQLSPAEREVALLLLKGLSHKEIAEVREVAENTVRQQARAMYRKAGLSGRNDLAAFFLEDLLGPPPAGEPPPPRAPGAVRDRSDSPSRAP